MVSYGQILQLFLFRLCDKTSIRHLLFSELIDGVTVRGCVMTSASWRVGKKTSRGISSKTPQSPIRVHTSAEKQLIGYCIRARLHSPQGEGTPYWWSSIKQDWIRPNKEIYYLSSSYWIRTSQTGDQLYSDTFPYGDCSLSKQNNHNAKTIYGWGLFPSLC